ncbi:MAG: hypothetical protein QNL61_05645 [Crocinitomicaceae bacterium]|mgnify:FL=1
MEQHEFLAQNVFTNLKNLNADFNRNQIYYFSEADFDVVLHRAEHFGIGIYTIEPRFNGAPVDALNHEKSKKKATDAKWYNKAFLTSKHIQPGMEYSATYKVSAKLLMR